MESNLNKSPNFGSDGSDIKYVSGLSTILVATIQEAKDRISQIEYIFCSQLFPSFQLNSQCLQKIYSEARKAAEDASKEREKELLRQIEKLQYEKQQILDENQFLKLEKARVKTVESQTYSRFSEFQKNLVQKTNAIEELEAKNSSLCKTQNRLEVEIEELRQELMLKSKDVDDVMSQTKYLEAVRKDALIKDYEQKNKELTSKLEVMENKMKVLLPELRLKNDEINKGKELHGNLLKKLDCQASEIMNYEQLLKNSVAENKLLSTKIESLLKHNNDLQNELREEVLKLEEVRKVHEQLLQLNGSLHSRREKDAHDLEEFAKEKKQFIDDQKRLQNKVEELQRNLQERTKESSERMEIHRKLLQQIEAKDSELITEKRKKDYWLDAYKKLKSQQIYLLKKHGLTTENMLPSVKMEDESEISRDDKNALMSHESRNNDLETSKIVTEPKGEQKTLEDVKRDVSPSILGAPKSFPVAGAKRPISYWRDTRSHQGQVGPDPHDDFLDTPLENVRNNLKRSVRDDNKEFPKPAPLTNMSLDNSDDETQDMNANARLGKPQMQPPKAGSSSGFKYVEPVRKKSERENLKGVECKQCKKFYDAVLNENDKSTENNKQKSRCEHHDEVSRHRYRYPPPSTPEGFWNIGFESEM